MTDVEGCSGIGNNGISFGALPLWLGSLPLWPGSLPLWPGSLPLWLGNPWTIQSTRRECTRCQPRGGHNSTLVYFLPPRDLRDSVSEVSAVML